MAEALKIGFKLYSPSVDVDNFIKTSSIKRSRLYYNYFKSKKRDFTHMITR